MTSARASGIVLLVLAVACGLAVEQAALLDADDAALRVSVEARMIAWLIENWM